MTENATAKKVQEGPITKAEVITLVEGKVGRLKDRPTKDAVNKRFEEVVAELSGQGELVVEIKERLDGIAGEVERMAESMDPRQLEMLQENIQLKIKQLEQQVMSGVTEATNKAANAEALAIAAQGEADYLRSKLGVRPQDESFGKTAAMAPIRFINLQPRLRHGFEFAIGAGAWLLIARLLETRFALPTGWVAIIIAGLTGVAVGEGLTIGGRVLIQAVMDYRASQLEAPKGRNV